MLSENISAKEGGNKQSDEILFGEGRSLQELKAFFPNKESMFLHYTKRMAETFPAGKALNNCEACHLRSAEVRVGFVWRAIYHTSWTILGTILGIAMAMGGAGVLPHKRIDFVTMHGLCSPCLSAAKRRKLVAAVVDKLCFALVILSAFILVPMLIFTPVILYPRPTAREILVSIIGLTSGLAGMTIGLVGARRVVKWCVPKPLRFISKHPFQLTGFK